MYFSFNKIIGSLPADYNAESSLWVKLWVRKASFLFTWLFINIGFSSNNVTAISIFVTIASCILYTIPSTWALITAVVLINFWLVLDCVDGNIARCVKQKKLYGSFIDAVGGYYTVAFIYLAIGISSYNTGGLCFEAGNKWILVAGAVSSISDILSRLIYVNYCGVLRKEDVDGVSEEKKRQKEKYTLNWLRKRVGREIGISGFFMFFTILGLLFNCNDILTLFYLLFNGFALLSTTVIYFRKADLYDKNLNK